MEYEIVGFEATDFKDPHSNYWCNIALKGVSEPVKIVVRDPTKYAVGQKIYGKITDETSKAGKAYRRFRREAQPEATPQQQGKPTDEYWADKDAGIKAQFAIKASIQYHDKEATIVDIENTAKVFFEMIDRVSGKQPEEKQEDTVYEVHDDAPINLDDIPF